MCWLAWSSKELLEHIDMNKDKLHFLTVYPAIKAPVVKCLHTYSDCRSRRLARATLANYMTIQHFDKITQEKLIQLRVISTVSTLNFKPLIRQKQYMLWGSLIPPLIRGSGDKFKKVIRIPFSEMPYQPLRNTYTQPLPQLHC